MAPEAGFVASRALPIPCAGNGEVAEWLKAAPC
jgi:hypothetical protein